MNRTLNIVSLTLAFAGTAHAADPIGTAFTYQGFLEKPAGTPVGSPTPVACDFEFTLWDDGEIGAPENQIGPTLTFNGAQAVEVTAGAFAVALDFGENTIRGQARWLGIKVCCPNDPPCTLQPLSPRVEQRPVPHALALPGLYTQQNVTSPNLIGGFAGNSVTTGVVGATISGGGLADDQEPTVVEPNRITDDFGTIGGGAANQAGSDDGLTIEQWGASVGGGARNTASSVGSTIGGGVDNTASSGLSTIGGGELNTASGGLSTIGGGSNNIAGGPYSTVGGGDINSASAAFSTVGGGRNNFCSGGFATIGGGHGNSVYAAWSSVGGGQLNTANGEWCTIGGGSANGMLADYGTIGGGSANEVFADYGTIGGGGPADPVDYFGTRNAVFDAYGTIGGGGGNRAGSDDGDLESAAYATVGGGLANAALGFSSTVGGGDQNIADTSWATVGGGECNIASGYKATIGGGNENTASGMHSTVGGGDFNTSSAAWCTVSGGGGNTASALSATVGGGDANAASGEDATVGGGALNIASGLGATIAGGFGNDAGGDFSFAGGRYAKVRNPGGSADPDGDEGTFAWADSTNADFTSDGPNKFLVRASGGTTFYSNSALTSGVILAAGGGSWSSISDKNLKENFAEIDKEALLEKLSAIPITTWNYKSQDDSIRHIGPMGQDFAAAFGVGEEETRITTIDADGVALAAIQGLYQIVHEKDCEIEELRARLERLEELLASGK